MIEIISIIAGFLIAFSIGSNDTSNSFGICIGVGTITLKKALYLLGFFVFIGAYLQGQKVMRTVGGEILKVDAGILIISLLISAIFIIFSNWKRLPISSHQVIIGSLIGSGFAFGSPINTSTLQNIVTSWAISPFIALFIAFIMFRIMENTLSKLPVFRIERILRILILFNGIMLAYNTGANELSTALAPVVYSGVIDSFYAVLVGSFSLWLGAYLLSGRVVDTICRGITKIEVYSGFAAQFSAGLTVLIFTQFGMPVSTTYCLIGGIYGVGILKGMSTVSLKLLKDMALNWTLTPLGAFVISYGVGLYSPYLLAP